MKNPTTKKKSDKKTTTKTPLQTSKEKMKSGKTSAWGSTTKRRTTRIAARYDFHYSLSRLSLWWCDLSILSQFVSRRDTLSLFSRRVKAVRKREEKCKAKSEKMDKVMSKWWKECTEFTAPDKVAIPTFIDAQNSRTQGPH